MRAPAAPVISGGGHIRCLPQSALPSRGPGHGRQARLLTMRAMLCPTLPRGQAVFGRSKKLRGGGGLPKSTGRSGRQNAATRRNMRREERVSVQGPVKKQQPDEMSHGGAPQPPAQTKVTIVGNNGIGDRENPIGPSLVRALLGPNPATPRSKDAQRSPPSAFLTACQNTAGS